MCWVKYENQLWRLPLSRKMADDKEFRSFQERNQGVRVMIHDPAGGYAVVPIEQVEYKCEEQEKT